MTLLLLACLLVASALIAAKAEKWASFFLQMAGTGVILYELYLLIRAVFKF